MKKENMTNKNMTNKERLDIIRKNISAFSDYLDETNQLGAIDDKAWDYLVTIEQAVGGIWDAYQEEKD